jgi:uracil-DNA glycosylase
MTKNTKPRRATSSQEEKDDGPKTLGDPRVQKERCVALKAPHATALTRFVRALRKSTGQCTKIPFFDPFDGGTTARCLFLLEAPGPKAVESGFISRNNPDESAKNFFELNAEVGIPRELTVIWNVVPWYVGDGTRIRPVTAFSRIDLRLNL